MTALLQHNPRNWKTYRWCLPFQNTSLAIPAFTDFMRWFIGISTPTLRWKYESPSTSHQPSRYYSLLKSTYMSNALRSLPQPSPAPTSLLNIQVHASPDDILAPLHPHWQRNKLRCSSLVHGETPTFGSTTDGNIFKHTISPVAPKLLAPCHRAKVDNTVKLALI